MNIGSLPWEQVASQGTLEISSPCQGTALPYFRRGVTCGEMEGYVWKVELRAGEDNTWYEASQRQVRGRSEGIRTHVSSPLTEA